MRTASVRRAIPPGGPRLQGGRTLGAGARSLSEIALPVARRRAIARDAAPRYARVRRSSPARGAAAVVPQRAVAAGAAAAAAAADAAGAAAAADADAPAASARTRGVALSRSDTSFRAVPEARGAIR